MTGYAIRMISVFLTAAYTLAAMQSCGIPEAEAVDAAPEESVAQEPKAIYILQSREDIGYTLQQAADRFTASEQGLTINIQTVAGDAEYRAALRSKLLAGDQVDIFHISGAADVLDLGAHLEDLAAQPWLQGAMEGTLEAVTAEGGIYGVPYSVEGVGLIANRNIFEVAGIPLADIQSFEDLSDALAELHEQIASGDLADAFPELEAVSEIAGQDRSYLAAQWGGLSLGSSFSSAMEVATARQPQFGAAADVEDLVSLLARYSVNRGSWGNIPTVTQSRQLESGVAKGRVAVVLQSTAAYWRIVETNPDLEGRLALLSIPMDQGETRAVYHYVPVYWAVNTGSHDRAKTQSKDFLRWLYTAEEGAGIVAQQFQANSAFRDTAGETGNTLDAQFLRDWENGETLPLYSNETPVGWGEDVFALQLQEYFSVLDKTWEEVMEACRQGWTERR